MAERKSSAVRKQEIVLASLEIIKEGGIQNLSLKKIARRIGISEQAIYRHFASKKDILKAVIFFFDSQLKQTLQNQQSSENVPQKLLTITRAHMEFMHRHPAVATVIFSEEIFQNEPEVFHIVKEALMKRLHHITHIVQAGQRSGEINPTIDAEVIARMLLGSLRLNVVLWRLSGFRSNLIDQGMKMVQTILQLVKPEANHSASGLNNPITH